MGMLEPRPGRLIALTLIAGLVSALAGGCAAAPARAQHLSSGCRGERRIALTFDDGPNPPHTQRILDLLGAAGARATFFDEGEAAAAHPDVVREELARGMAVGSHSWSHSRDLPSMSHADFAADLRRAEDALAPLLGQRPALYRAPYGHTSDTMLEELRRDGYVSVGWDVDSADWSDAEADRVVTNVLEGAHPGAIVLMHDGGLGGGNPDRSTTLAALPRILDGLRQRGYELVTVPELTGAPEVQGAVSQREAAC